MYDQILGGQRVLRLCAIVQISSFLSFWIIYETKTPWQFDSDYTIDTHQKDSSDNEPSVVSTATKLIQLVSKGSR